MFLDFYQLKEQPFGVTPNPDFLYLGEQYREALASMVYAVRSGRGFHALIAPPGLGKTTLLFRFVNHLRDSHKCVFLFNTLCDQREFLRFVTSDLELSTSGQDLVEMQSQLNDFLVQTAKEGKSFLLVVDEAQNLRDDVLEMVRLLSNFETPRRKLMHIVLAGQPQLETNLCKPHLSQLRQRVSLVTHLKPLGRQQVQEYVEWRLRAAGSAEEGIFRPGALDLIAVASEGIPRNINNLCFHALSLGFAKAKHKVTKEIVEEAIAENSLSDGPQVAIPNTAPVMEPPIIISAPVKRLIPPPVSAVESEETKQIALQKKRTWDVSRAVVYACVMIVLGLWLIFRDMPRKSITNATTEPVISSAPVVPAMTQQSEVKTEGPVQTAAAPSPVEMAKTAPIGRQRAVVVQANETLWEISLRELPHLGPIQGIDEILRVNEELKNPAFIRAGQKIVLPAASETKTVSVPGIEDSKEPSGSRSE
jgi:type II secretory pathway predicted ATPase ExeA/LysM repeat protein